MLDLLLIMIILVHNVINLSVIFTFFSDRSELSTYKLKRLAKPVKFYVIFERTIELLHRD